MRLSVFVREGLFADSFDALTYGGSFGKGTCDGARLSSHGPDNQPSQPKSSHPEKSSLSNNDRHACLPAQSEPKTSRSSGRLPDHAPTDPYYYPKEY